MPEDVARLRELVSEMAVAPDFPTYRRTDVAFHLAIAEAAGSCRLVSAMT